jgi:hypothetical protein
VRIPNKPIRDGLKIYSVCDAETGYVWFVCTVVLKLWRFHLVVEISNVVLRFLLGFEVQDWVSEDRTDVHIVAKRPYVGSTSALVVHLAEKVQQRPLIITMDNYFTSCKAFRALRAIGVHAVGTVRHRSDVPAKLLWPKARQRRPFGAALCFRSVDRVLLLQAWQDSSSVHVLSTCHGGVSGRPEKISLLPDVTKVSRQKRNGLIWNQLFIPCPPATAFYQNTMRGVDLADAVRNCFL